MVLPENSYYHHLRFRNERTQADTWPEVYFAPRSFSLWSLCALHHKRRLRFLPLLLLPGPQLTSPALISSYVGGGGLNSTPLGVPSSSSFEKVRLKFILAKEERWEAP